ncbi:alpha-n-arabinofuranosidase a precursor [Grosmannia clavigera kw1407]|uniref:non-reducing end alpha-L-arabinofuranosidase n=1 Tax=Grosmannia clavigera (strain kw1407 / UAMH 11150) TaxID=655863 RepID=F0XLA2_GROCL|nr:alpha-n-arabinofuranosidase a precursor [Grosmannia clavigera kw1407]EFX01149.1 alpha-n-arabinofuranosidase a precursor [Grosmannia clavigera kw1407]
MTSLLRGLILASAVIQSAQAVTLSVSTSGGNASSPLLWGYMFEDINNSGDGGIHGQVLKNNGFQPGYDTTLTAYAAVGGSTLSIDTANPLSTAITSTLKVTNPSSHSGTVGFSNSGYNGVPVDRGTYKTLVWIKGTYSGQVTVSLVSNSTGTVFGSVAFSVKSTSSEYTYYDVDLPVTQSSVALDNVWRLTYDASAATDGHLNFALPQLFPETYKGRANGLRNDVATFLDAIGGSFLRWPGGNNLEGNTIATRWIWNETIGPVQNRPGHLGTWSYINTDALGLMEYLYWAEDMGIANVLAVWAGHALDGTVVTGSQLAPYVDDILDELEFVLGDSSTPFGALRASYGREEPFKVDMIEVGNEDNLSKGCSSYASRFTQIYNAIHAAYPDITVIASTTDQNCLPTTLPSGVWTDIHYYLEPNQFVARFNEFDNWSRTWPIFVGEYASTTGNDGSTTYWSNLVGSCSEAVYMIGLERNSDIVKMASFAPLLEHFDLAEWSPDLFGLDSSSGSLTGSTSYYVQQLFASNRGTTIKPVTSDSAFGPVYWVASSTNTGTYYVKLANYGTTTQSVTVKVPGASFGSASLLLLSGNPTASNYPHDVTITPTKSTLSGSASGGYTFSLPEYAVAVVVLE